ncbi:hypothetical protein MA16_Dca009938 [Dendrobium catenatum]|uniref:Uncharacterized protein n=1 Tax=Dendrobium catenatum TaxID=906689 RepID=A0A2I0WD95_9ASPA|nr:hypothetical protein MA16_Dca009938 [Dendrobium catenatum]
MSVEMEPKWSGCTGPVKGAGAPGRSGRSPGLARTGLSHKRAGLDGASTREECERGEGCANKGFGAD